MAGYRLDAPAGTALDRSRELSFTLNGRRFSGYAGDTLASALLAAGERFIGRSFKYHRPRGIASCGAEEPTGLLDVGEGARRTPNSRATDTALVDGLMARSGNAWPSLRWDLAALNSLLGKALTAGFYYKTFMWPSWHLFEPAIRRAAGLGHAADGADPDRYEEISLRTELLVVGAGLAGLEAAATAAEAGRHVLIMESDAWAGGWAATLASPELAPLLERVRRAGVEIRLSTTVFGLYDHGLAVAISPGEGVVRERTLKIRAERIILATGAFDRPMLFPDNDRPGLMFAHAAERYAQYYGVAVGRRIVLATACDAGLQLAERLRGRGLAVEAVLDRRAGDCIVGVSGRSGVSAVRVARPDGSGLRELACDALLHTGGLTPNVSLHSQAGGGLRWDDESSMFVPARLAPGVDVVGACAGVFDTDAAREHARRIGRGEAAPAPVGGLGQVPADNATPASARPKGKVFVDLQNDVCAGDIAQAAQENYRSVEHLKRYTTTGMATDQGKNSNVNALVMIGGLTGRAPAEVGTTKFRPPFKPVTLGAIAAGRSGERYRPLRRLPAHAFHAARGAAFEDFGGWLRPAAYLQPGETLEAAARREAAQTRRGVALFEASSLGKIEVFGPDAAAFLDLMYVGTMSTLAVGAARYGLLLGENGVVVDDGIVARLGPQHFWVNTSSGGVERTALAFEEWLQCEYVDLRVLVQPVTSQWGNVTLAGPQAWTLLAAAGFDAALAPAAMMHMSLRVTEYAGTTMRVLRASFSGELGYEINLPALQTQALFERMWAVGQAAGLDLGLYGIEALMLMRLEKGYLHIGSDTDGTTLPQDLGMLRGLDKKAANFVGRRSLLSEAGRDADRKQLVGLLPLDRRTPLPVGTHICTQRPPAAIDGFVTSSGFSPALGQPVALAMLTRGAQRLGERVRVFHMNQAIEAEVVTTPFFDAAGERLHG
ncbi:2Fe-2S iron-sulfur cluster-binding protein [Roseateles sp.]|uniref:2Fe-2S iron-sulfur cluster-binding protein n=1 Tax=Roseateles sp. TaxID=1971397 RepID=UPI0039EC799A